MRQTRREDARRRYWQCRATALSLAGVAGRAKVMALGFQEMRVWRDGLAARLAPATVNRTSAVFKADLNLAAARDMRITSQRAWETGPASIADAEELRNIILPEEQVRSVIAASYGQSEQFGLLVEVAAVTGARPVNWRGSSCRTSKPIALIRVS